ncbi:MAG: hypothetical protein V4561_06295 [Bacteroidota bacterium]
MNLFNHIIPKQSGAAETKTILRKKCSSEIQAVRLFRMASERLLDINNWGFFVSKMNAIFSLTDNQGGSISHKQPEVGNLIRMQLPGPPNADGSGYDWVRIEKIEREKDRFKKKESLVLSVRPIENPLDKKKETNASLYTIDATSTFAVIRKNKTIWVLELGRHTMASFKSHSTFSQLRNYCVTFAAYIGLFTSQWKALLNGILSYPYSKLINKELDYI